MWDVDERRTRHEKSLQHTAIHQLDVFRLHAFIVVQIIPEQHLAVEEWFGGVVLNGEKIRQNLRADLAGERLAFVDVFLTETFGAMPEHFVKENSGCAAGEQRRACVR